MNVLHLDRRSLRHAVWAALGAWLFALTAGVVSACMLRPQVSAGHDTPVAKHGHEQRDVGNDACLKFCGDEPSVLSKSKSPTPDGGVPLAAAVAPWNPMAATTGPRARLLPERPSAQGPPLVIRFLRLTL